MKHLILGSAGQIGMALSNYFKAIGDDVLDFDIENNDKEDLRIPNNEILKKKMDESDFVYFLAFDVGGSRYLKTYQHSQDFLSNNARLMESTFTMLQKCEKPFIFASSQMSNMAYSPYGVLKALGEAYTKSLNGLVVKFWNVYGVEHDLDKSHVITDFILSAKEKGRIDMLTDGVEVRQFLHANDCSACLENLARNYNAIPRDMNLHITSFKWNSINEVANIIADIYPGTQINRAKQVDEVQRDARNEPDPAILNFWKPKIELIDGIQIVNAQMHKASI